MGEGNSPARREITSSRGRPSRLRCSRRGGTPCLVHLLRRRTFHVARASFSSIWMVSWGVQSREKAWGWFRLVLLVFRRRFGRRLTRCLFRACGLDVERQNLPLGLLLFLWGRPLQNKYQVKIRGIDLEERKGVVISFFPSFLKGLRVMRQGE